MCSRNQQGGDGRTAVAGFTLIEILVVMALIGVLAGLILGIGYYAQNKITRTQALTEMDHIKSALDGYREKFGEYIDDEGTFDMNRTNTVYKPLLDYVDPSQVDFMDPWEQPYQYERVSRFQYRLWSFGPDSLGGNTEEMADDITNWRGE